MSLLLIICRVAVLAVVACIASVALPASAFVVDNGVYIDLLHKQQREIKNDLRQPGLSSGERKHLKRDLRRTRSLLASPENVNNQVYLGLLQRERRQIGRALGQPDLSSAERKRLQRSLRQTLNLIGAATRLTSTGYLVGSAKGSMGAAVKRVVSLQPFDGRSDRPIYIDPAVLPALDEEAAARIRLAALDGQMIVLLSPTSRDIGRFRKLLDAEKDIADSPGPLLAVRRVTSDYAEFSVAPSGNLADANSVQALLRWQRQDLNRRVRAAGNRATAGVGDSSNLTELASAYLATRLFSNVTGFLQFEVSWDAIPCYKENTGQYFIFVQQTIEYIVAKDISVADLKKEVEAAKQRFDDTPFGPPTAFLHPLQIGWVNTSEMEANLRLPNVGGIVIHDSQPASNGTVTTSYSTNTSLGLDGSISFLGAGGAFGSTFGCTYSKTATATLDGALITNQRTSTAPSWKFTIVEPELNRQRFPLLNSTSSWIWIIPGKALSSKSPGEPVVLDAEATVDSSYTVQHNWILRGAASPIFKISKNQLTLSGSETFRISLPPSSKPPAPGKPELTEIKAITAEAGYPVTIIGKNLSGVTALLFGTAEATHVNASSDTSISAFIPQRQGSKKKVPVTVVGATGDFSNSLEFTYQ